VQNRESDLPGSYSLVNSMHHLANKILQYVCKLMALNNLYTSPIGEDDQATHFGSLRFHDTVHRASQLQKYSAFICSSPKGGSTLGYVYAGLARHLSVVFPIDGSHSTSQLKVRVVDSNMKEMSR